MTRPAERVAGSAFRFAAWILLAWAATWRMRGVLADGTPVAEPRRYRLPETDTIFALRERDAFALAPFLTRAPTTVLVAHGRDGDLAAGMVVALGGRVVRGASRRGGDRALVDLLDRLAGSEDPAAIVVDGPLGPAGVAKPGAARCALATGRPLRALVAAARPRLRFPRTWSGLYLPLPGARVVLSCDEPLPLSAGDDPHELAARLSGRLAAIDQLAERALRERTGAEAA